MNLTALILSALQARGRATVSELVADLGRYIPAPRAAAAGRCVDRAHRRKAGRPCWVLVASGKRALVSRTLRGLLTSGRVVRIKPGLWRPTNRLRLFAG